MDNIPQVFGVLIISSDGDEPPIAVQATKYEAFEVIAELRVLVTTAFLPLGEVGETVVDLAESAFSEVGEHVRSMLQHGARGLTSQVNVYSPAYGVTITLVLDTQMPSYSPN